MKPVKLQFILNPININISSVGPKSLNLMKYCAASYSEDQLCSSRTEMRSSSFILRYSTEELFAGKGNYFNNCVFLHRQLYSVDWNSLRVFRILVSGQDVLACFPTGNRLFDQCGWLSLSLLLVNCTPLAR